LQKKNKQKRNNNSPRAGDDDGWWRNHGWQGQKAHVREEVEMLDAAREEGQ